jgi:hypothetical protein
MTRWIWPRCRKVQPTGLQIAARIARGPFLIRVPAGHGFARNSLRDDRCGVSETEKRQLFYSNAIRIYRLSSKKCSPTQS